MKLHLLCPETKKREHLSNILYFFTYKPSDFCQYILTEIWVIFHEKQGLTYIQGFGIKKKWLNSVVLLFSRQHESDGRSLTFRVSAFWNTIVRRQVLFIIYLTFKYIYYQKPKKCSFAISRSYVSHKWKVFGVDSDKMYHSQHADWLELKK